MWKLKSWISDFIDRSYPQGRETSLIFLIFVESLG